MAVKITLTLDDQTDAGWKTFIDRAKGAGDEISKSNKRLGELMQARKEYANAALPALDEEIRKEQNVLKQLQERKSAIDGLASLEKSRSQKAFDDSAREIKDINQINAAIRDRTRLLNDAAAGRASGANSPEILRQINQLEFQRARAIQLQAQAEEQKFASAKRNFDLIRRSELRAAHRRREEAKASAGGGGLQGLTTGLSVAGVGPIGQLVTAAGPIAAIAASIFAIKRASDAAVDGVTKLSEANEAMGRGNVGVERSFKASELAVKSAIRSTEELGNKATFTAKSLKFMADQRAGLSELFTQIKSGGKTSSEVLGEESQEKGRILLEQTEQQVQLQKKVFEAERDTTDNIEKRLKFLTDALDNRNRVALSDTQINTLARERLALVSEIERRRTTGRVATEVERESLKKTIEQESKSAALAGVSEKISGRLLDLKKQLVSASAEEFQATKKRIELETHQAQIAFDKELEKRKEIQEMEKARTEKAKEFWDQRRDAAEQVLEDERIRRESIREEDEQFQAKQLTHQERLGDQETSRLTAADRLLGVQQKQLDQREKELKEIDKELGKLKEEAEEFGGIERVGEKIKKTEEERNRIIGRRNQLQDQMKQSVREIDELERSAAVNRIKEQEAELEAFRRKRDEMTRPLQQAIQQRGAVQRAAGRLDPRAVIQQIAADRAAQSGVAASALIPQVRRELQRGRISQGELAKAQANLLHESVQAALGQGKINQKQADAFQKAVNELSKQAAEKRQIENDLDNLSKRLDAIDNSRNAAARRAAAQRRGANG